MEKGKIAARVSALASPLATELGLELVDVEYVKERDWYLRVYIDKPQGIDIDDCSALSRSLGDALDNADFIKEKYYLEVSSPGLDRPLKTDRDLTKHYGEQIDISLFAAIEGVKELTGTLVRHDAATITIERAGEEFTLRRETIACVKLHLEF